MRQGAGVQFFPSLPAVGQDALKELPETRAVAPEPVVTQLVQDHVIEAVDRHRDKPEVQGDPSPRRETPPAGFHRTYPQGRQGDVLRHPAETRGKALVENDLSLSAVPPVEEFLHVLCRPLSFRRDVDVVCAKSR